MRLEIAQRDFGRRGWGNKLLGKLERFELNYEYILQH